MTMSDLHTIVELVLALGILGVGLFLLNHLERHHR